MLDDGDVIEKGGYRFRVNIEDDDSGEAPWERDDGHGPVSDWTSRDKLPGERVLNTDHGRKRYYDVAEATRIAKRDCWGLGPEAKAELVKRLAQTRKVRVRIGEPVVDTKFGGLEKVYRVQTEVRDVPGRDPNKPLTPGEITAEAVRLDYEFLRGWCNDDWRYVGVIVTHLPDNMDDDEVEIDYRFALWGIESDADDYIEETAHELIDECIRVLEHEAEQERIEAEEDAYWAARDVMTLGD